MRKLYQLLAILVVALAMPSLIRGDPAFWNQVPELVGNRLSEIGSQFSRSNNNQVQSVGNQLESGLSNPGEYQQVDLSRVQRTSGQRGYGQEILAEKAQILENYREAESERLGQYQAQGGQRQNRAPQIEQWQPRPVNVVEDRAQQRQEVVEWQSAPRVEIVENRRYEERAPVASRQFAPQAAEANSYSQSSAQVETRQTRPNVQVEPRQTRPIVQVIETRQSAPRVDVQRVPQLASRQYVPEPQVAEASAYAQSTAQVENTRRAPQVDFRRYEQRQAQVAEAIDVRPCRQEEVLERQSKVVANRPYQQRTEQVVERQSEVVANRPYQQRTEQVVERQSAVVANRPYQQRTEQVVEKQSEVVANRPYQQRTVQVVERQSEVVANRPYQQRTEQVVERQSGVVANRPYQQRTEQVVESKSEVVANRPYQQRTEQVVERQSEVVANRPYQQRTEQVERQSAPIPENRPQQSNDQFVDRQSGNTVQIYDDKQPGLRAPELEQAESLLASGFSTLDKYRRQEEQILTQAQNGQGYGQGQNNNGQAVGLERSGQYGSGFEQNNGQFPQGRGNGGQNAQGRGNGGQNAQDPRYNSFQGQENPGWI